jgi:phospholipase/lecithinase/hemolysin
MVAVALDTHRIVQRLRAAGFDERQAETVTDVMIETRSAELGDLAAKADLAAVRAELAEFRAEVKADIARLDHRITLLEQTMNARFEGLEQRMTIKLGLMMVAGIAAVATLVKLL